MSSTPIPTRMKGRRIDSVVNGTSNMKDEPRDASKRKAESA